MKDGRLFLFLVKEKKEIEETTLFLYPYRISYYFFCNFSRKNFISVISNILWLELRKVEFIILEIKLSYR